MQPRSGRLLPHPLPAQPAVPRSSRPRDHRDRERVLASGSATSSTSGEEARNAATLRRNFAGRAAASSCRKSSTELTRRRVLVLEYMEGTRIDRLHERLASGELRLDALMTTLVEMLPQDDAGGRRLSRRSARRATCWSIRRDGWCCSISAWCSRWSGNAPPAGRDGARRGAAGRGRGDQRLLRAGHPRSRRGPRHRARCGSQPDGDRVRDDVSPRQIQQLVEEVLRTFYEWPLMLPSNLVYFGRAAVLVEGIGLRYDPGSTRSPIARPVVGALGGPADPGGAARRIRAPRITDWTQEALGRGADTAGPGPPGRARRAPGPLAPARHAGAAALPGAAGAPRAARLLRVHGRAHH